MSDAWKQFAALFLQEHPACERCEDAEQSTPATQVVPVIEGSPALRWRGENLQALCDSCAGHYEEVAL